jgi:hypothetical protein
MVHLKMTEIKNRELEMQENLLDNFSLRCVLYCLYF